MQSFPRVMLRGEAGAPERAYIHPSALFATFQGWRFTRLPRRAGIPQDPDERRTAYYRALEEERHARALILKRERRFNQKVCEIYATAINYNPTKHLTLMFFAIVQHKLHWAVHGCTAAEHIAQRPYPCRRNSAGFSEEACMMFSIISTNCSGFGSEWKWSS